MFANFTGHASVDAFYAEFDAWAVSATETSVLAVLESNENIETQIAVTIDVTGDDFLKTGVSVDGCTEDGVVTPSAASTVAHSLGLAGFMMTVCLV